MDKFLPVTTKSTRNELLMQLMQESKSVNQNVVLVIESLPTFINTSVSLAVFNAMLKQYPKNLYWYSNNLAIINFLKISNITSIWKPPINSQPSKLSEQLSTYVSQSSSPVRPQASYVSTQNTNDLRSEANQATTNRLNTNQRADSNDNSEGDNFGFNRERVTISTASNPNLALPQVYSDLQPKIQNVQAPNPSNDTIRREQEAKKAEAKMDSRLYNTANQIKRKLARNIALLPKFPSKNAETLSLEDDINKIQAPDFNNLDDLISKIESTKEALEKKHNKLNKNLLDSEISMDAKNNMGWMTVIGVGFVLIIVLLVVVWWFRR